MGKPQPVQLDRKCRLSIPKSLRDELNLEAGDTIFVRKVGSVLELTKAVNPFDALATHAVAEYNVGRTRNLRDLAAELGEDVDNPEV
jgi:AbrB family looped-hinge helix DNA binding protein